MAEPGPFDDEADSKILGEPGVDGRIVYLSSEAIFTSSLAGGGGPS